MPLTLVKGDPILTQASMLAIGHNAKGRTEMDDFTLEMMRRYPAAFSAYTRQARKGRVAGGEIFLWTETLPRILFVSIRDSAVGATRLRYVQKVLMTIARDYLLLNIASLAIAPLGNPYEREEIQLLYPMWLQNTKLPIIAYTEYLPDLQAEEGFS